MAATLASISDYQIDWQKQEGSWINALYSDMIAMMPKSTAEVLFEQLPEIKQIKQQVSFWDKFQDGQNRYIYCINCADIK